MPKLTKRVIEGLQPTASPRLYFDDELARFAVRVMATGVKSYVVQYRSDGRTRRFTFGKVGVLTPEEARDQARQLLAAVDRGEDPAQARLERRAAATMADLCQRYLDQHVAVRCKPTTSAGYRRTVQLFIIPALGVMKVADVERRHVADLHHRLRRTPYQANQAVAVLSKMFNLAELWGMRPDGSNPCRHVSKYREIKRERFLSAAEMGALGTALSEAEADGSETISAIAAFRLLILTGCRLGEIQTLKWDYIQGDFIALPDSKSGAKRVMLGQAALLVLSRLPRDPENPYVITGKLPGAFLTDLQHPWRRIRARAGLNDVRIHDLRHSFASSAVGMGESLPMIGKLLGHTQVQTTARYAHLAHDPLKSANERISAEISRAMGMT